MTTSKKHRKNNHNTKQKKQQQHQKARKTNIQRFLSFFSPTGIFWGTILLILTVVGSYYTFTPKLSVSYSKAIHQTDLLSTPFTVRNNSLLSIEDITYTWESRKIITSEHNMTFKNVTLKNSKMHPIPHLEAGEPTTIFVPVALTNDSAKYADIDIIISYRPKYIPFKVKSSFRFTGKIINNEIFWFERSTSEK